MRKLLPTLLVIILPVIWAGGPARAQETGPEPIKMTLAECLARAVERNPDISAEALSPEIEEKNLRLARDQFLPSLSLDFLNQDQTVLGTWGAEGTSYSSVYNYYNFSLSQRLPTGAEISLGFLNQKSDTERAYTVINPSYYSNIELNVTQPLLKGFGPAANRMEIRRASNNLDTARAALMVNLTEAIYQVESAYWTLVDRLENLSVLEETLEQSRTILARTQEAARVGAKSVIDVLSAETEVARYEDSVVAARLQVQKAEDSLRKLMNMPPREDESDGSIVPVDDPVVAGEEPDLDQAIATALNQRPEILIAEKSLASAGMELRYNRNQALPELNLRFTAWNPGQSGIRYVYENDDPFGGEIIDIIRGSRADAIKDIFKGPNSWNIGLNLRIPVANLLSRAAVTGARLKSEQEALKLESRKRDISHEVAEAGKEVGNQKIKTESASAYRRLLEKRLAAEMERYNLGLAGSEWLFNYQSQLAQARSSEIRALIDYRLARTKLEKVMGTLLEARNVKFRDMD